MDHTGLTLGLQSMAYSRANAPVDLVEFYIEHGADVNAPVSVVDSRFICGDESLTGYTALSIAILMKNHDMVRVLNRKFVDLLAAQFRARRRWLYFQPSDLNSNLQWESYLGNVENVKRCIRNGADVNAPVTAATSMLASINPSYIGKPPLSVAMSKKHNKVVRVLREHGAITWDPQFIQVFEFKQQQALAASLTRSKLINSPQMHQSSITNAPFNFVAERNMPDANWLLIDPPFNSVAERNMPDASWLLIDQSVVDHEHVGFISQNTGTDVHIIDVAKLLETANKFNQDTDHQIKFSEIESSINGTKEGFKELLQGLKGHAVYWRDGGNRNVLHLVAEHEDFDRFKTLVEELGGMLINLLNEQDKDGRTALILAVLAGNKDIVAHLCRKEPRFAEEILPNIEDNLRKTALDHAQERNESSMVMELMKRVDVQYYQEEQYREMQLWAENVNKIGAASGLIATLMFASNQLYVAPMNFKVAIWSSVCFSFALCGMFAASWLWQVPNPNSTMSRPQ